MMKRGMMMSDEGKRRAIAAEDYPSNHRILSEGVEGSRSLRDAQSLSTTAKAIRSISATPKCPEHQRADQE
jgi:hypothetical protein